MEQRTDDWYQSRLGRVTASRMADVMAKTKTGYGASRANYMAQLICERLTGQKADSFSNAAMQRGTEAEPQARAAYEFMRDVEVAEVGFIDHPTIPMFGASPDGLVGDDGLVEFKCPNTATHIETLLTETIPQKYMLQMQTQMICTGRAWCDYVSFDPRLSGEMQLWVRRVERDDAIVEAIETETTAFLKELDAKVAELRARYMQEAA